MKTKLLADSSPCESPDDELTASIETVAIREHGQGDVDEDGDLLARFEPFLREGCHLAIMPISRVHIEWEPITYRDAFTLFPPCQADLGQINIVENEVNTSLAEACSALSGITGDILDRVHLVAFPCRFSWNAFQRASHRGHVELIRQLSESVDRLCLDFVRYRFCTLDLVDTLPGRAGQITGNPMMSGACLYNHSIRGSRIIGGAAFTHLVTQGLGLELDGIDADEFPSQGEVGHVVGHALRLYAAAQEASSQTAKLIQSMGLLEYLAFPDEFCPLKKVRAVIVHYAAHNAVRRAKLTERFKNDLFGPNGYRTQIVHNGGRIEQLLPAAEKRKMLFREMDGYIRLLIEDMLHHSELTWAEFLDHRKTIGLPDAG